MAPVIESGQKRIDHASEQQVSIDEVIADLVAKQRRLSDYIDARLAEGDASPAEVARLLALHGQNASRLGRLLRDRQVLGGPELDELAEAVGLALDELSAELGIEL